MAHTGISPFIEEVLPDYERVRLYFLGKVGCEHEARDLVQETFARLLRWQPSREVEHPERVLFRTARNLLVDRFRTSGRLQLASWSEAEEELEEFPDAGLDPAQRTAIAEQLRMVSQAVGRLPEVCREVFVLNRFMGFSYVEVAKHLKISSTTVERHMVRAILTCKRALKDEH